MTVKKVPRRISEGESFGSSIHNALKRFGELEMLLQQPPEKKQQLTLFTETHAMPLSPRTLDLVTLLGFYRECFIAEGYENATSMNVAFKRGEEALRKFFEWWSQKKRTVLGIESGFKLSLPRESREPLLLSGRFDRVEQGSGELCIIDYKTSNPRTQESVDLDLQLSIYALAAAKQWKTDTIRLSLLFLSDEGCIERCTLRRTEDLLKATEIIARAASGIEHGDFTATPSRTLCASCPYRAICSDAIF